MSRARSWSVKGIDQDTRALARRASKAAGMTIGGWVDHAIRQAAFKAAQDAERQRIMGAASLPASQPRPYDLTERPMPALPTETIRRALAESRAAPTVERDRPVEAEADHPEAEPAYAEAEAGRPAYDADTPPDDRPDSPDDGLDDGLDDVLDDVLDDTSREPSAVAVEKPGTAGRARYTRLLAIGLVALAVVVAAGAELRWIPTAKFQQALHRAAPVPGASRPAEDRPPRPGPVAAAPGTAVDEAPPVRRQAVDSPPAAETEIQRLLGAARQGSPEAQLALARAYAAGKGVAKDDVAANRWLERAATQGLTAAQMALAERNAAGLGAPADAPLAAFWYRKAADNGDATAAYRLGRAYADGHGVPRSAETAAGWYQRAAANGNGDAMMALARMYADGVGVRKDRARAAALYRDAVLAGNSEARGRLISLGEAVSDLPAAPQAAGAPKPKPAATAAVRPVDAAPPPPPPPPPAAAAQTAPSAQPAATVTTPRPAPSRAAAKAAAPAPARVARSGDGATRAGPGAPGRLSKTAIAEMQRLLGSLDFKPGPPDGNLGPQTVKAIRQYQVFAGLEATGVASPALLDELRSIVRTLPAKTRPVSR